MRHRLRAAALPLLLLVPLLGAAQELRIVHVTIASPERTAGLPDAQVLIHQGRIVAIGSAAAALPPGAAAVPVLDGRGLFLMPGLIDSHVHLGMIPGMTAEQELRHPEIARAAREQMPRSFLLYGFTTLIDLISTPQELARWQQQALVPDTYFCGGAALIDGYPMNFVPKPARYTAAPYMLIEPQSVVPAGIERAAHTPQAVVARMKADGAICVKTFFERGFGASHDLPVPALNTVRELVAAAHAAGLPVLLHANSTEAQAFGLAAGVDILAHGLWNWNEPAPGAALTPAVKKVLDGVLDSHTGWQPTLQVLHGERDLFSTTFLSDPQLVQVLPTSLIAWYRSPEGQWFHDLLVQGMPQLAHLDAAAQQAAVFEDYAPAIARVRRATSYLSWYRGRLLFGTDTPSAPTYANPPGLNGWFEIQELAATGLTPGEIFGMATLGNARALKLDHDIGTVEVGKRANLLLLRSDPTVSIEAYRQIVKVVLGGRVLDPAQLSATAERPAPR